MGDIIDFPDNPKRYNSKKRETAEGVLIWQELAKLIDNGHPRVIKKIEEYISENERWLAVFNELPTSIGVSPVPLDIHDEIPLFMAQYEQWLGPIIKKFNHDEEGPGMFAEALINKIKDCEELVGGQDFISLIRIYNNQTLRFCPQIEMNPLQIKTNLENLMEELNEIFSKMNLIYSKYSVK